MTLASMLGVQGEVVGEGAHGRLEALEHAFMEKAAEFEQMKEMMTMLLMTNPNVRVVGAEDHQDLMTSGSTGEGPDGRLLN